MVDKNSSAFSIDAILASGDCSRSARIGAEDVGDFRASMMNEMIVSGGGGGPHGFSSKSTSVDDADWLRQVFTDVALRLVATPSSRLTTDNTMRTWPTDAGKKTDIKIKDCTKNNTSSLFESDSTAGPWTQRTPWLKQLSRSVFQSSRTPSGDDRISTISPERRGRLDRATKELLGLSHSFVSPDRMQTTSIDQSGPELRREKLSVVDGHHHRHQQTAARSDDAVSCYFGKTSPATVEADGGSTAGTTWLAGFLRSDSRDDASLISPDCRRNSLSVRTDNHHKSGFNTTKTDSTPRLWSIAFPSTDGD